MTRPSQPKPQLFGEARALVFLAVKHPGAPDLDAEQANRLAASRVAAANAVRRHGGVRILDNASVTVFAWGTDRGGRRCLSEALEAAKQVHTLDAEVACSVEVQRATVWRETNKQLCLVAGPGPDNTTALIGPPGSLTTGANFQALREGDPQDDEQRALAHMLAMSGQSRHPLDFAVATCLVLARCSVNVRDLAQMLDVQEKDIAHAVARLEVDGIAHSWAPEVRLKNRAAALLLVAVTLPAQRQTWLRRHAEHINATAGSRGPHELRRAAQFAERAGDVALAARLWRASARRAISDGASDRAVIALRRARRLAGKTGSMDDHVEILTDLGALLRNRRSGADPEVIRIYSECHALLAAAAPSSQRRFDMLFQLQINHLIRGDIDRARTLACELLAGAQSSGEPSLVLLAKRTLALTALMGGDLRTAQTLYQVVVDQHETTFDEAFTLRYGSNQLALAMAGLAWAVAVSDPPSGDQLAKRAWSFAEALGHDHTKAHVAVVLATRAQMLSDLDAVATFAAAALRVAEGQQFGYWRSWSRVLLGWLEAHKEGTAVGLARIDEGLVDYVKTGARQALPYLKLLKADVVAQSGDYHHAFVTLSRAERFTRAGRTSLYRAAVLRAAARVAKLQGYEQQALSLARKAYNTAARQGAELFCRQVIADVTEFKGRESAQVALLAAVRQRPD